MKRKEIKLSLLLLAIFPLFMLANSIQADAASAVPVLQSPNVTIIDGSGNITGGNKDVNIRNAIPLSYVGSSMASDIKVLDSNGVLQSNVTTTTYAVGTTFKVLNAGYYNGKPVVFAFKSTNMKLKVYAMSDTTGSYVYPYPTGQIDGSNPRYEMWVEDADGNEIKDPNVQFVFPFKTMYAGSGVGSYMIWEFIAGGPSAGNLFVRNATKDDALIMPYYSVDITNTYTRVIATMGTMYANYMFPANGHVQLYSEPLSGTYPNGVPFTSKAQNNTYRFLNSGVPALVQLYNAAPVVNNTVNDSTSQANVSITQSLYGQSSSSFYPASLDIAVTVPNLLKTVSSIGNFKVTDQTGKDITSQVTMTSSSNGKINVSIPQATLISLGSNNITIQGMVDTDQTDASLMNYYDSATGYFVFPETAKNTDSDVTNSGTAKVKLVGVPTPAPVVNNTTVSDDSMKANISITQDLFVQGTYPDKLDITVTMPAVLKMQAGLSNFKVVDKSGTDITSQVTFAAANPASNDGVMVISVPKATLQQLGTNTLTIQGLVDSDLNNNGLLNYYDASTGYLNFPITAKNTVSTTTNKGTAKVKLSGVSLDPIVYPTPVVQNTTVSDDSMQANITVTQQLPVQKYTYLYPDPVVVTVNMPDSLKTTGTLTKYTAKDKNGYDWSFLVTAASAADGTLTFSIPKVLLQRVATTTLTIQAFVDVDKDNPDLLNYYDTSSGYLNFPVTAQNQDLSGTTSGTAQVKMSGVESATLDWATDSDEKTKQVTYEKEDLGDQITDTLYWKTPLADRNYVLVATDATNKVVATQKLTNGASVNQFQPENISLATNLLSATEPTTFTYTIYATDSTGAQTGKGLDSVTFTVNLIGSLRLVSVPETIDFNLQAIDSRKNVRVNDPIVTGDLTVSDTRDGAGLGWTLKVSLTKPFENTDVNGKTVVLADVLRYKAPDKDEFLVTDQAQAMASEQPSATSGGKTVISSQWGNTQDSPGFKFESPPANIGKLGEYNAEITYTISVAYEP